MHCDKVDGALNGANYSAFHGVFTCLLTPIVISGDDVLVFSSGVPSFGEQGLFRLRGLAVVDEDGQIAEAGGESGFQVPGIDEAAALSFTDGGTGPFKAVETKLRLRDKITRDTNHHKSTCPAKHDGESAHRHKPLRPRQHPHHPPFSRLRSGHRLIQRPSPITQISSSRPMASFSQRVTSGLSCERWRIDAQENGALSCLNPKTEIEPQISQMDTDDEEVTKDLSKPV